MTRHYDCYFDLYCKKYFGKSENYGNIKEIYEKVFSKTSLSDILFEKLMKEKKTKFCGIFFYEESFVPREFFEALKRASVDYECDFFEFCLCAYIVLCEKTENLYRSFGIGKDIFDSTLSCIARDALKNREKLGKLALYDYRWCAKMLALCIFRIGSFEFQPVIGSSFENERIEKSDIVIKIHVPEKADISKEARLFSYAAAYDFFCGRLHSEKLVFSCESWLLAKDHEELLGNDSNIVSFRHDFEIIEEYEDFDTGVLSRIFGDADITVPERLPGNTALMRAYKNKLIERLPFYSALGIFSVGNKEELWKK